MQKKMIKKALAAAVLLALALTACSSKPKEEPAAEETAAVEEAEAAAEEVTAEAEAAAAETAEAPEETAEAPAEETAEAPAEAAGEEIPLKDNKEEAEYQIKVALQYKLEEMYGENVNDARIYVDKIYSTEEEQAFEPVKEMGLGPNEVAFEARLELHPAEGADVNMLLIPNGELDEESGWVVNVGRLGVLRENPDAEDPKYIITDFGTGW